MPPCRQGRGSRIGAGLRAAAAGPESAPIDGRAPVGCHLRTMTKSNKILIGVGLLILVGLAVLFTLPSIVDRQMNRVAAEPPYHASEAAQALHRTLFVADLHGDTLLWDRDLRSRHDQGHIDLPRLKEGHVGLQVFATVTKTPRGQNFEHNSGDSDNITLLAVAERWPP